MALVRHPIIVLEGADAGGKSTLGYEIVKLTGARYVHMTYRFKNSMWLYQRAALQLCLRLAETQPVVLDRWWPSDVIYGTFFRDGPGVPKLSYRLHDRVAQTYGLTYVYCCPSDRAKQAERHGLRAGEGGEMYDTLGRLPEMYREMWLSVVRRDDTVLYDVDQYLGHADQAAELIYQLACDNFHSVRTSTAPWVMTQEQRRFSGNPCGHTLVILRRNFKEAGPRSGAWPLTWLTRQSLDYTLLLESRGVDESQLCYLDVTGLSEKESDLLVDAVRGHKNVISLSRQTSESGDLEKVADLAGAASASDDVCYWVDA